MAYRTAKEAIKCAFIGLHVYLWPQEWVANMASEAMELRQGLLTHEDESSLLTAHGAFPHAFSLCA